MQVCVCVCLSVVSNIKLHFFSLCFLLVETLILFLFVQSIKPEAGAWFKGKNRLHAQEETMYQDYQSKPNNTEDCVFVKNKTELHSFTVYQSGISHPLSYIQACWGMESLTNQHTHSHSHLHAVLEQPMNDILLKFPQTSDWRSQNLQSKRRSECKCSQSVCFSMYTHESSWKIKVEEESGNRRQLKTEFTFTQLKELNGLKYMERTNMRNGV